MKESNSVVALRFTPAFGREEALCAGGLMAGSKTLPFRFVVRPASNIHGLRTGLS